MNLQELHVLILVLLFSRGLSGLVTQGRGLGCFSAPWGLSEDLCLCYTSRPSQTDGKFEKHGRPAILEKKQNTFNLAQVCVVDSVQMK